MASSVASSAAWNRWLIGGCDGQASPARIDSATTPWLNWRAAGLCGVRLVVEKAMTKSPLEVEYRPPARASPRPRAR